MPLVTMPDGQVVEMPDELSPELAMRLRALQRRTAVQNKQASLVDQIPGGISKYVPPSNAKDDPSLMDKWLVGTKNIFGSVAEPVAQMASGMIAKPVSEVSGIAAMLKDYLTGEKNGDPIGFKKSVQEALTYQPTTSAGKSSANPLNAIPEAIGHAINVPTNAIANTITGDSTADSLRGMAGNAVREAIPQGIGLALAKLGNSAGGKAESAIAEKQSALNILKSQDAEKIAVIKNAKDAGYVFTPDELRKYGGGHTLGHAAEDVASLHVYHTQGEASALDKMASFKNAKTTENIARNALELPNGNPIPKGTPLSVGSMEAFRKIHNGPYDAIKSIKEPIVYTPEYIDAVKGIDSRLSAAIEQYPSLMKKPMVQKIQDSLLNGEPVKAGTKYLGYETEHGIPSNVVTPASTNGKAAIQLIQKLREEANKTYKSAASKAEDIAIADVKREAAGIVEDLIGQHLEKTGKTALLDSFRHSRENMAKSFEIEKALKGTNVLSAKELAKSTAKLTGGLEIIRDMAKQHPLIMSDVHKSSSAGGGLAANALVGVGVGAATGNPLLGAAIAGRPLLRNLLLSKPYQSRFANVPDYRVNPMLSGATGAISPTSGMMGITLPSQAEREREQ